MTHIAYSLIFGLLLSLSVTPSALAEYDAEKLGQAIGGYICATDMFEKLTKSYCGYAVKRKYSFKSALNETLPYLKVNDRAEIKSLINTKEFNNKLKENDDYISGFLIAGKKDGLDQQTLCGMLISNVAHLHQYSLNQWNYAKEHYAK